MKISASILLIQCAVAVAVAAAFTTTSTLSLQQSRGGGGVKSSPSSSSTSSLHASSKKKNGDLSSSNLLNTLDRRGWLAFAATASSSLLLPSNTVNAQVFLDPAQYGDQELRVSAVDTVRESVRRAILQNPKLAPAFYQLALTDALSFQSSNQQFGPDGWTVLALLNTKSNDAYIQNLQSAASALLDTERAMRKKTAITLADAVAIAGAESIESIGGPVLPVQLGRADHMGQIPDTPLDLLSGKYSTADVTDAFRRAGLTDREMTALLAGLWTLERVEKSRSAEDWRQSAKPKFREAGKIGRMSDFKALSDEDIIDLELRDELEDPDDGWYISDSFGTRADRFGQRLAKDDITEQTFNKYITELVKSKNTQESYIAKILLDDSVPTAQTWLSKYGSANLSFLKDLKVSYNSLTQLGAVYTGGKYENLLKNKPRKSLNDDGLNLF